MKQNIRHSLQSATTSRVLWLVVATVLLLPLVGHAQVKWLQTEHDFGAFDEDGGKVNCLFRFVNLGEQPVQIDYVRTSCGCTVPEYSHQKVQRGDTAAVTAVYNPAGRPGRFTKTLVVRFADDSTQKLTIKGVVIGAQNTLRSRYPVTLGPIRMRNELVTFGSVKKGKMRSEFIELYNASTSPVVPSWSGIPKWLRVTAAHDTIPPGEQGVYSMVLNPLKDTPYGVLTDSITLNIPGQQPTTVKIAAVIEEDFSRMTEKEKAEAPVIGFDQDMLDFGDFDPNGQPIVKKLKITNHGKSDLLLRRVHTEDPAFTLTIPKDRIKKGKSMTVTIALNPSLVQKELLNSRLQIISNDPSHPLAVIRLVGIPGNL